MIANWLPITVAEPTNAWRWLREIRSREGGDEQYAAGLHPNRRKEETKPQWPLRGSGGATRCREYVGAADG